MVKYIIRRLVMLIGVLLGVSLLVFVIFSISQGDPATIILGMGATPENVEQLREELGLNDPFFVRYLNYIGDALRLDFGNSWRTGAPVFDEILSRFPVTINLTFYAMLLAIVIGIPVGIISAVKQYTFFDNTVIFSTLILTSLPPFWVGLMLMLLFSLKLDLFPATGVDSWINYILPCITIATRSVALIARMTRSTMLEVVRQDYIRTAKAKGASWFRIIKKHCLRNVLIPIVTVIGVNFGLALGGVVLIESVFTMPGVGILLVEAIRSKDLPIVMADLLLLGVCFSVINLIVDILYGFIDPRLKYQYK